MLASIAVVLGVILVVPTVGYFLVGTGHVVVAFTQVAWRMLGARHATTSPAPPDGQPYLPYLLHQLWRDLRAVLVGAGRAGWRRVAGVHRTFWRWFNQASPPATVASLPLAIGLVAGTGLVAVPAVGMAVALLAVPGLALVLWNLALLGVLATLGSAEWVLRRLRRIVVACPHPGCYQRFPLPAYACPAEGCRRRHTRLAPGPFGLLRHACGCGASLPTLGLLGRHRLAAVCPGCDRALPRRTGQVRIEHVPVIGGPDAGKSTWVCLAIGALEQALAGGGGAVDFPDPADQARWRTALVDLRSGVRLPKTPLELPAAVMLDLRPTGGAGRLLYLFDPAGETYDASELLDSQRYLDHAEVALVVVDPLAIPGVRRALTAADQETMAQETMAKLGLTSDAPLVREGPGEMVDRVLGVLRTRAEGGQLRRVLLVVSKSDLLRQSAVGAPLAGVDPDVAGWLEEVGWGNWVRALRDSGGEVRCLASGLDIDDATLVAAVEWLVGERLAGRRRAGRAGRWGRWGRWRTRALRPWRTESRPELVPRGHAAGRLMLQLVALPVALLAAAAAPVALAWWLWPL